MIEKKMRCAMAMIELIFAIVVIAISIITIPMMLSVADKASKGSIIDDDVMSRLSGWTFDKFQARWDGNYSASGSGPLWISTVTDLNCSRSGVYRIGSEENISSMRCDDQNRTPSTILSIYPDGNISKGIERLNGGSETITIAANYDVNATYAVRYVDSTVQTSGNTQTAIWRLGSSGNMFPDGSLTNRTHLKRVVTRFNNPETSTDIVLTFFKSNKGN